jgi:hypothetical protein
MLKGRSEEALTVLKRVHGGSADADAFALSEYGLMVEQERIDRDLAVGWGDIFTRPSYRKRALIGFTTTFLYPALGFVRSACARCVWLIARQHTFYCQL